MPIGLQLTNDAGSYIIDSENRNLCLAWRRTIPASAWQTGTTSIYLRVQLRFRDGRFNAPMVFARAGHRMAATAYMWDPGALTIDLTCWANEPPVGDVDLLIFDSWIPPQDGYGLEVFDAQGNVVFNSGWPILMLTGAVTLPPGTPSWNANHQIPIETSNLAVAIDSSRSYYYGGDSGFSLAPGFKINSGSVDVGLVIWDTESETYPGGGAVPFNGYFSPSQMSVLLADVSMLPTAPYGSD